MLEEEEPLVKTCLWSPNSAPLGRLGCNEVEFCLRNWPLCGKLEWASNQNSWHETIILIPLSLMIKDKYWVLVHIFQLHINVYKPAIMKKIPKKDNILREILGQKLQNHPSWYFGICRSILGEKLARNFSYFWPIIQNKRVASKKKMAVFKQNVKSLLNALSLRFFLLQSWSLFHSIVRTW